VDEHAALARHFATTSDDKFAELPWAPAADGSPILHHHSGAWAELRLEQEIEAGDHLVLIEQVTSGEVALPESAHSSTSDTASATGPPWSPDPLPPRGLGAGAQTRCSDPSVEIGEDSAVRSLIRVSAKADYAVRALLELDEAAEGAAQGRTDLRAVGRPDQVPREHYDRAP
jgi:hypothetical protein